MRSLVLSFTFFFLLVLGLRYPAVLGLGYMWVDITTPHLVAYSLISNLPASLIMGVAGIAMLPTSFKHGIRPFFGAISVLIVLLAVWMSLTLLWAEVPDRAFQKWDVVIKTLAFCALMPLFFRTERHLEACIWVFVISGMFHCIPYAIKTALSGGGYGYAYGLTGGNSGFGEGSTLAMLAVMLLPLCQYLRTSQVLLGPKKVVNYMLLAFMLCCVLTAIGTFARTGLICLLVLGLMLLLGGKRKFRSIVLVAALALAIFYIASDAWMARMGSTTDSTEVSSMSRVAVWLWVWDYVNTNPWGGSFNMFMIGSYALSLTDGSTLQMSRKAFHSIYFEALGEGGFVALGILLALWGKAFFMLRRLYHQGVAVQNHKHIHFAKHFAASLVIYLVGGNFIGVAFQSFSFMLIAMVASACALANASTPPDGH
jgi:probable O-glycosylation ligase (exosortase A-associated)